MTKTKTIIAFRKAISDKGIQTRGHRIEIIPRKSGLEWDGNLYNITDIHSIIDDFDEFDIYQSPLFESDSRQPEIVGTVKREEIINFTNEG